jgi:hypothetical protein
MFCIKSLKNEKKQNEIILKVCFGSNSNAGSNNESVLDKNVPDRHRPADPVPTLYFKDDPGPGGPDPALKQG